MHYTYGSDPAATDTSAGSISRGLSFLLESEERLDSYMNKEYTEPSKTVAASHRRQSGIGNG